MYEFTCVSCGKVVQLDETVRERKFCSKKCYGAFLKGKKTKEIAVTRPSRFICEKGLTNLIAGICNRAAADFMQHPPGSWLHDDAVRFFQSDYFAGLTDIDGEEVVAKLNEKRRKRRNVRYKHRA